MNRLVSLPSAIQDKIVESLNTLTVSEPLLHYLLFSPIRILELPDEILSVIFLEFILSSPWPIDSPYSRQFKVLTLTWTCSRFRNICISVPQLWAFHYIPPNESMSGRITSPAFYAKLEDYTRLALSYSKNGPLHIRIYNPKASAADLLFAASARWKSAHITRAGQVSDYIGFGFLPKHVNGQHPLFLESLSLESDNFYPLLSLVYSPTLRNLHVIDMILQLPVPQVNDSHRKSQIRNISGSASLPVLYTFLELCPKIEQLGVVQKPYLLYMVKFTLHPIVSLSVQPLTSLFSPVGLVLLLRSSRSVSMETNSLKKPPMSKSLLGLNMKRIKYTQFYFPLQPPRFFEGLLDVLESRRMRTAQLNDDDTSLDECGVAYLNEIEFTGNLHMMPEVSVYGHRVRKLMGLDSASKRAWFNNGLADIIGV
ncbi:hypothetical protein BDP27DRAFT_1323838 [Rhodocollybia butyracea]|uniref:F-box domain-containing protein n=1 Tax=Rhodocollybia butyracea TaxID=206335 RepID=A0A9P5U8X0_9AGAR|nr:hypothetical protein BDP27DRAFT_1323838 [Rhodocollybia butyracea]